MLAIGFTESNLNYTVKHPTDDLVGIGGLKKHWRDACKGEDINPNSLQCIEYVYSEMLYENRGNEFLALCDYKGAVTNFKSVQLTRKIAKQIRQTQKDNQ